MRCPTIKYFNWWVYSLIILKVGFYILFLYIWYTLDVAISMKSTTEGLNIWLTLKRNGVFSYHFQIFEPYAKYGQK